MKRSSPWDKLRPAEISESAPINALPDSLLLDIFEVDYYQVSDHARTFPLSTSYSDDDEKATTRSILRVCRRWNAIATPLLYRRVHVELRRTRVVRSTTALLKTLQSMSRLRSFTREVDIFLDSFTTPAFTEGAVMSLVRLLCLWEAGLRSASIHGCIDAAESRPLLLQLGKLALEEFTFSGFGGGISLSFLLTHFDLSKTKKLRLHRVSSLDWGGSPGASSQPLIADGQMILPLERHHLSGLKELDLSEPFLPAQTLSVLFRLPKSLERLRMTYLMESTNEETYTVAAIEKLLHPQRHSLRSIEFGYIFGVNDGLQLTKMTALESLTLNKYTVFCTSAVKAASRLAAPKLKYFNIRFATEEQHADDPMGDVRRTTSWLQEFMTTRRSFLPADLDTLEEIKLLFCPGLSYGDTWESVRQPWQSLEQTRTKFESFGVILSYAKPISDEGDWHKYLDGTWLPPDIPDETDATGTDTDEAEMCCSDDVDMSERVDSFTELDHDPAQTRLCRRLGLQVSCVH